MFPVHSNAFALSGNGEEPVKVMTSSSSIKTPEKHSPNSENIISVEQKFHYDQGVGLLKDLEIQENKKSCNTKCSQNEKRGSEHDIIKSHRN